MSKYCLVFLMMGLLAACNSSDSGKLERSPYGVWSTERGHVVIITKDDKYTYCERKYCTVGQVKFEGALGVVLVGFMHDPATLGLRVASHEEERRKFLSDKSNDYDFTEMGGGMSQSLRKSFCNNKPCVPIGELEGDAIRFIKTENF